jgi:hypothetical protein
MSGCLNNLRYDACVWLHLALMERTVNAGVVVLMTLPAYLRDSLTRDISVGCSTMFVLLQPESVGLVGKFDQ